MADEFKTEKIAFEPFGTLEGVLKGQPFKIFPQGTWYRGDRKLDVSAERLKEFAANVKAGRPQFRIPINLNHNHESGKVGSIDDVEYLPDAKDGPGLYATKFELSDKGKKAIKDDGYDQVSGEAVWSLLDGAKWQDNRTGQYHDNVLVGLALTPTGFWGKDVALFTANPTPPKRGNGYTKLREMMKAKFDELMAMVKDEDGDGEPDDMPEMPPKKKMPDMNTAETPVADAAEQPAAEAASQGVETMAEVEKPTPPATEQMTQVITAEQFAAVQAELAAQKQTAENFRVELAKTNRARRLDQLTARVDAFMAIGAEKAELATKLLDLEEKAPELFGYFDGLLAALDGALVKAELFDAKANGRQPAEERGAETFAAVTDKVWAEKYDRDPAKYEAAAAEVAKAQPKLYQASRAR